LQSLMLAIQHRLNPLHVYCRLADTGLDKKLSMSICKYYEVLIYTWVSWFTVFVVKVNKVLES
jgi:hypothetical protein